MLIKQHAIFGTWTEYNCKISIQMKKFTLYILINVYVGRTPSKEPTQTHINPWSLGKFVN